MKRVCILLALLLGACSASPKPRPTDATRAMTAAEVEEEEPLGEVVEEEVSFLGADSVTLRGTLLHPSQGGNGMGVVVVHDWGIRARDGRIGGAFGVRLPTEVAVYRDLAESLAARGFAVLIYDKRNCAATTAPGCTYPASWPTDRHDLGTAMVEDAAGAASWLGARKELRDLALIGHGHGAEIAAVAAQQLKKPCKLVLLAPPAQSLQTRAQFQYEESLRLIDARIAELGDVPEGDLLKTRRQELVEQRAGQPNALGVSEETATDLESVHQDYLEHIASTDLVAIVPGVDPGEPATRTTELAALFSNAMVVIDGLSRTMVSVAQDADPTVVAPEVVHRIGIFLSAD